ncbi:MAG: VOC family protein [Bryobacteraceae bacterium]
MPIVSQHPPGAPCWFELGTTDQVAAKQFYDNLFGWTHVDIPMRPDEHYTMFQLDGQVAASTYTLPPKLTDAGVPPHWGVYFAVENADATAAKATELGGEVVQPAFDVMDAGRLAIIKDPGGATFSVWQTKTNPGVGVVSEVNSVGWVELATWDTSQANTFYSALFGWQTKGSANMATYLEFSVAGVPRGGLLPMDASWKGIPAHWGIYVRVADCAATVAQATSLGATVRFGPFNAPGVGWIALIVDPQSATFYVIQLT